jgi:hypothetical protein
MTRATASVDCQARQGTITQSDAGPCAMSLCAARAGCGGRWYRVAATVLAVSLWLTAASAQTPAASSDPLQSAIAALEAGDIAGAERRLRQLAGRDPEAIAWLASALIRRGDRPALAEAIKLLSIASAAGNARAQYFLAFQYASGQGVRRDEARSAQLFRAAAEAGISRAAYNLGVLYARGRGVPRDEVQALGWYERAAQTGDPYGAHAWARMLEASPQATARAADIATAYRTAAEQGHLPAALRYGALLSDGRLVRRDPVEAQRFFRHAADNGYPEGALALGDLSAAAAMAGRGDAARDAATKAVAWYTTAANAGVPMAQFKLANALFSGAGAERDLPKAEFWYSRAAHQGLADAQYVLGVWKSGGVAGPKDGVQGYRWLLLAERQGNTNAGKVRLRTLEALSVEDRRAAEAAADAFRVQPERPRAGADDEAPPLRPMPKRP